MKVVRSALLSFLLLAGFLTLASPILAQDSPTYTVQPGDTLTKIAKTYSTTVPALVDLNKKKYACLATKPACLQIGWVLVVTGAPAAPKPAPAVPTAASPAASTDIEQAIVDLTNQERAANGLPPLARNEQLAAIARWKSQDMVTRGYFAHNDPVTGRFLISDLVFGAGLGNWAGENLAWFNATYAAAAVAENAVQSWIGSPGHRQNMLRPEFTLVGAGVVRHAGGWTVTQALAGP